MGLTSHLEPARRSHVDARLAGNLMAWFSTVSPTGRPNSVPVWFLLQEDDTVLLYSEPGKAKLRYIAANPNVALGLDVTDIGRDIIRIDGTAQVVAGHPSAAEVPAYAAKYTERIGAIFGTVERFAGLFSEAIVVTPSRLHA